MLARLKQVPFSAQVLAGLVLGVVLGLVAREMGPVADGSPNWLTSTLATVGSSFVSLLRTLVVPLVLTAIIASIANLRGVAGAARLAGQTLLWFAITALIAVSIGIALGLLLQPGDNTSVTARRRRRARRGRRLVGVPHRAHPEQRPRARGQHLARRDRRGHDRPVVQRPAAARHRHRARRRRAQDRRRREAVPRLQPVGARDRAEGAVVGHPPGADRHGRPARQRRRQLRLGRDRLARRLHRRRLRRARARAVRRLPGAAARSTACRCAAGSPPPGPRIQLAFVSRSSLGTLPVTEQVTERLGVPRSYASFAVPLGATTKMDGCAAIYPALSAIFVAQFFGIALSVPDYLLIVLVSVLGSAATAGTTGATVMLTLTLSTLGLPLAGVGLLLAVDPILDMGRTAVNVAGQALVPTIVAKREGILDEEQYASASIGSTPRPEPVPVAA